MPPQEKTGKDSSVRPKRRYFMAKDCHDRERAAILKSVGVLHGSAWGARKRRQAGRTPNASRQSTPGEEFAPAFGVRPACRRFRTARHAPKLARELRAALAKWPQSESPAMSHRNAHEK